LLGATPVLPGQAPYSVRGSPGGARAYRGEAIAFGMSRCSTRSRYAKTTNWTSVCCFKTCLMEWPVFVLLFACFSIWGSWSSVEKKKPKKIRARHRGCAPTPGLPLLSAPPPLHSTHIGSPGRVSLGRLFRRKLSISSKICKCQFAVHVPQKLLFSCLRRRWELMSTSRLAIGRRVV
jgi:hypothetical protein